MTSERLHPGLVPLAAACLLTACAASPPAGPREYLDEQTAATVTVGVPSYVFARERPELAVHARDYLTLVPIDVNRGGAHAQYFFAYVWSTIDKRGVDDGDAVPQFELVADGRRIPLAPVPANPRDLGIADPPVPPPARAAMVLLAATTREAQEFVAAADEIVALAQRDGITEPYVLWTR